LIFSFGKASPSGAKHRERLLMDVDDLVSRRQAGGSPRARASA
jgi:hypothetical protein